MDRHTLKVFLYAKKQGRYGITITFPATPYQLQDAKDRARVQKGDMLHCRAIQFKPFDFVLNLVGDSPCPDKMITLAQRLSKLDEIGQIAFEGLVDREMTKGLGADPLERLITLAYNTDYCDVYPGIIHHEELGHHYVDNDLYSPARNIPEEMLPILNYKAIGEKMSRAEGGILTSKGYVILPAELKEAPQDVAILPDYFILLEISLGEQKTQVKLPSTHTEMDKALGRIGATGWSNVTLRCLDCAAPALIPYVGNGDNIAHINRLAQRLQTLEGQGLTMFKAILDATKEYSVLGATNIVYSLNDYLFSPQYIMPEDLALDVLSSSVGEADIAPLLQHVNLDNYGRDLIQKRGCILTDYGLVSRADGTPITPTQTSTAQPEMGGMTMQ